MLPQRQQQLLHHGLCRLELLPDAARPVVNVSGPDERQQQLHPLPPHPRRVRALAGRHLHGGGAGGLQRWLHAVKFDPQERRCSEKQVEQRYILVFFLVWNWKLSRGFHCLPPITGGARGTAQDAWVVRAAQLGKNFQRRPAVLAPPPTACLTVSSGPRGTVSAVAVLGAAPPSAAARAPAALRSGRLAALLWPQ